MSATTEPAPTSPPATPAPTSPPATPATAIATPARRSRLDWTRILLEGFFVTLGVLLALAADEWRQNHAERRHADFALASIHEELETNRDSVLESLNYHLALATALRQGADSPAARDGSMFSKGFVFPAPMMQTAWESAKSTDALSNMEYSDVLTLARIYERQRTYEQQGREVGSLIYAKLFNEGMERMLQNAPNLSVIISTFWYRECELLRDYDVVFGKLADKPVPAAQLPEMCRFAASRK